MKLKDTIKLFKYTNNKIALIILTIFFLFQCLIYIFAPLGTLMVGFMASLSSTYFVNFVYQILVSGMIRSSEKAQKSIFKNFTIILLVTNVCSFILFIIPRYFFMLSTDVYAENTITIFLLNYIVFNIMAYVSLAVIYKRMALGTTILIVLATAFFIQMPFFIHSSTTNVMKKLFGIKEVLSPPGLKAMPSSIGLLIVAFAVTIISPFIFYLISILMRKVSFSKYLEDRQQWGK